MYDGDFSEFPEWDDEAEELDYPGLYKSPKTIKRKLSYRIDNLLFSVSQNSQKAYDLKRIIHLCERVDTLDDSYKSSREIERQLVTQAQQYREKRYLTATDKYLLAETYDELRYHREGLSEEEKELNTEKREFESLLKKQRIQLTPGDKLTI